MSKRSSEERERAEMEAFKKRLYTRRDERGNIIQGVRGAGTELAIPNIRRCQNCIHYNVEQEFLKYFAHCVDRDRHNLTLAGKTSPQVRAHIARLHRTLKDARPVVGFCTNRDKRTDPEASADFTHYAARCDQWTGKLVVSPFDPTPDPDPKEFLAEIEGNADKPKGSS